MWAGLRRIRGGGRPRWWPPALLVLGVLATAVRLDAPADPGLVRLGWSAWQADGVVVDVAAGETRTDLRDR